MSDPLILWFRRDLRLDDNPMLAAAVASGRPLVPVFIGDEALFGIGAAPKWRWGLGIGAFRDRLRAMGGDLVLRRGDPGAELNRLIAETGATGVWWGRLYDPTSRDRDAAIKATLKDRAIEARSFDGHTLAEPWQIETKTGGYYKVFTPYWRALSQRGVTDPAPAPKHLAFLDALPKGDDLEAWRLGDAMNRGALIVGKHVQVGEAAARARLARFLDERVARYADARDLPGQRGTSGLSENLTYGEISPRRIWAETVAREQAGAAGAGAETFRKELAWRDFAHHLMYHSPHILTANWRPEWDAFPWSTDPADAQRWMRGMTGEPFVDAGMRELYVTGTMHNRTRMIVASYLTKHLMVHWKIGLDWFADCLIDWDPASNAMGWQWAAGSGPDAAPYFRVFNPATQVEKFDKERVYRKNFISELSRDPPETARDFFDAAPRSWGLSPGERYPLPMVDLAAGRERALAVYSAFPKG